MAKAQGAQQSHRESDLARATKLNRTGHKSHFQTFARSEVFGKLTDVEPISEPSGEGVGACVDEKSLKIQAWIARNR